MLTVQEAAVILFCLEEFVYGKISALCALTCTLAKEVQLSPDLGIYSGIVLAIYSSKKSRTATIVFYVLFTLAVISLSDLLSFIIAVSNDFICTNMILKKISYADPHQDTIASTSN